MTALHQIRCLLPAGCPWSFTGTPEDAETEARRHVGGLTGGPTPGHPVTATPVHATQAGALDEARAQYHASGRAHEVTYDGTWWHVRAVGA